MTWLDIVCTVAFFIFLALAHKRGVVLEVADLLCIIGGGFFAFRTFRPIAGALKNSVFSGFSLEFLERFCLFTVFIICSLVIFAVGLNFQRKVKEEKILERELDERLGVVVGFFKTIIVLVLFLGLLFYNDAFPKRELRSLKGGFAVSILLGLDSFVKPIIYVVAPSDLAAGFIDKGLGDGKATSKKEAKAKAKGKTKKKAKGE